MDTNAYNNFDILGRCLNGMFESMLIVNKVPTQKLLKKKRQRGERVSNRNKEIKSIYSLASQLIGISFKYEIFSRKR